MRAPLRKLLLDDSEPIPARIAALGTLQSFWNDEVRDAFIKLMDDGNADLRRLAAEGLALNCRRGDGPAHEAMLQALSDSEPAVRRAAALAMGKIAAPGAEDILVNTLSFDEGKDAYLYDGLLRAVERTGKPGIDRLLDLAESGVAKDLGRVVEAFTALRTREAAEGLPRLLRYPHLSDPQKTALLRSYMNYLLDPPISTEPLFRYLTSTEHAPVVKLAGLTALVPSCILQGDEVLPAAAVLSTDQGRAWLLTLLEERDPSLRLAAIKAVADLRVTAATTTLLQGMKAKDQPPGVRAAMLRALAVLAPDAAQETARGLVEHTDAVEQREAVEVLGQRASGAKLVGRLFVEGRLPRDLRDAIVVILRRHAPRDEEAAALLAAVLKARGGEPNKQ
jgi:HEAT repeat protein